MSQRAPESLSEQPMFFDGDTKKTFPVPTSAGTNVVVGLRLIGRFDPPGLAFFDLGDTRLLLETGAPSALLYLRVDDPAAALERLRAHDVDVEQEAHVIFVDTDGQFGTAGENEVMG